MRRSGEDERWRRGRPIENYGKKEEKEWLDNTLPDPHPVQQGTRRKKRKSGSTILYLTLTLYSREQGGRRERVARQYFT